MFVVNTETVPGYRLVRTLGIVQGNTVRAKHVGRDFMAGLKNLVGGELRGYTELLIEARRDALRRMLAQAEQLGANAVVNVRFSTSAVTQGAAELYAYGTAVVIEAEEQIEPQAEGTDSSAAVTPAVPPAVTGVPPPLPEIPPIAGDAGGE